MRRRAAGAFSAKTFRMAAMLVACLLFASVEVFAQCPLCKAAVQSGSSMARALNLGIVILLVPPVTIFCSIFIVAYKRRKDASEAASEEEADEWPREI